MDPAPPAHGNGRASSYEAPSTQEQQQQKYLMMMGMPQQVVGGSLPATPRTMQQVPPQPAHTQAQVAYQNSNHRKRPHPSVVLEETNKTTKKKKNLAELLTDACARNEPQGWRALEFGFPQQPSKSTIATSEKFRKLIAMDAAELKGYLSYATGAEAPNMHPGNGSAVRGSAAGRGGNLTTVKCSSSLNDSSSNHKHLNNKIPTSYTYLAYSWGVGRKTPTGILEKERSGVAPYEGCCGSTTTTTTKSTTATSTNGNKKKPIVKKNAIKKNKKQKVATEQKDSNNEKAGPTIRNSDASSSAVGAGSTSTIGTPV